MSSSPGPSASAGQMRGKFLHGNVAIRAIAAVAILLVVAGVATASATLLFTAEESAPPQPQTTAQPPVPEPARDSGRALRDGQPGEVGLNPVPISMAQRHIAAGTEPSPGRPHPPYAGEVSLLARNGTVVSRQAAGYALRYADASGPELPPQQQERMQNDTIFDIASLTKLFTSIAVLQLADDGRVHLNAPVADYVPEFAASGKQNITVEQLLTHTSGLQAKIELWRLPPPARMPAVLGATPQNPPGTAYRYSDLNMITLGVLVERVSGRRLDQVVHDRITAPLGMSDTGYNPTAVDRTAATEYLTAPPRGMVRGEVHDENAWSLGGVAGHAGVFATASGRWRRSQAGPAPIDTEPEAPLRMAVISVDASRTCTCTASAWRSSVCP